MLLRTTGSGLLRESGAGTLVDLLVRRFHEVHLYKPGASEQHSWEASLGALARLLDDARLGGLEVLVEYHLPLSSLRVDAVLIGTSTAGGPAVQVCELKQWSVGEVEDVEERLVRVAGRLLDHPQQQVAGYVEYIKDFIPLFEEQGAAIGGFVFLHNAPGALVDSLRSPALAELQRFPMFGQDQVGQLREALAALLSPVGAAVAADRFLSSRPRPSKALLDHVSQQVAGEKTFTLVGDQQLAFDLVRSCVERAKQSDRKTVVIVAGGPGTGKSVIATQLLGQLGRSYRVLHATGSRSFTTTLRKKVGARAAKTLKYFNSFMDAVPNDLDVLVCDEAHRIRESSNSRWTKAAGRSDRTQVEELLLAARVPVFLLDENQVVRPNEVGTVELIRHEATAAGYEVEEIRLDDQFRCGGSAAFIYWVERLLGLEPGGPINWVPGSDPFELSAASTVEELEVWVRERDASGATARLSAGFCWPWSDPTPTGQLVNDVVIDSWKRPWNSKGDRPLNGIPPSQLWASDPAGVGQVGCIYTAQGFEYDHAGVIIGDDLIWRDGQWLSDRKASRDNGVLAAENFDQLVRHVYKVLLTRGLVGCSLYSTDDRTNEFIGSLIAPLLPTKG